MSLRATYVLADDGLFYKDPVLSEAPEYSWFICFDDEDPIELVLRDPGVLTDEEKVRHATALLDRLGLTGRVLSARGGMSGRLFPPDWFEGGFSEAISVWIELRAQIPVSVIIEHSGAYAEEPFEGVYDFRKWRDSR